MVFAGPRLCWAGAVCLLESDELLAECSESFELVIDLGDAAGKDFVGVPAGAGAVVADVEEFADVSEPEAGSLATSDEPEAPGGVRVVSSVAVACSGWGREESSLLPVADGVGGDAGGLCEFGDGESHGDDGKPWSGLQGQELRSPDCCLGLRCAGCSC